ncbi:hypothetical protein [uncultured Sneathiella sp.]|uniref:hypothetical protein n=1 Tax=uncultured Sneathiella sp. TaxID=879315 RepID=UPI002596C677|nr:hypothetical protein [uncultured Sneathiella sp.]
MDMQTRSFNPDLGGNAYFDGKPQQITCGSITRQNHILHNIGYLGEMVSPTGFEPVTR